MLGCDTLAGFEASSQRDTLCQAEKGEEREDGTQRPGFEEGCTHRQGKRAHWATDTMYKRKRKDIGTTEKSCHDNLTRFANANTHTHSCLVLATQFVPRIDRSKAQTVFPRLSRPSASFSLLLPGPPPGSTMIRWPLPCSLGKEPALP